MASEDQRERLRALPAVDRILERDAAAALMSTRPRWAVVEAARGLVDAAREGILRGDARGLDLDAALDGDLERRTERLLLAALHPVINATGVVLHPNLGRAPLAPEALEAMARVAEGYSNLEYDLGAGRRGSRHGHLVPLLRDLTGAEAALVCNNNAGALMLAVAALADGGDVIVSRGELVEIGGSFRVPDVIAAGGVRLVEVGTTNRTHLSDYKAAVNEGTGAILKVHRSNFTIEGFTAEVEADELVALGADAGIPIIWDLGSGCLVDLASRGLPAEQTVGEAVASSASVVTFSGDKLLGGPQAGIVCGQMGAVDRLRSHPMMRALRPGKGILAGLEATLRLHRDADPFERVPTLAMLTATVDALEPRARALRDRLAEAAPRLAPEVREVNGRVGGGAMPGAELPSAVVALDPGEVGASAFGAALREAPTPVVARMMDGRILLDVRTVADAEYDAVVTACTRAMDSVMPC